MSFFKLFDAFSLTKKYNALILSLGFISWFFNFPIPLLIIITIIMGYIMITKTVWTPIISPVMCLFFCINRDFWYSTTQFVLWIGIVVLVFFLVCLFIHKHLIHLGKLSIGFFLLGIASILSLINILDGSSFYIYLVALSPIFYLPIYIIFVSFMGKNKGDYFGRLLVMLGIMITFQIFSWYLKQNEPFYIINKLLDLGWGISNTIAIFLNLTIAINCFFLYRTQSRFVWSTTLGIQAVGLIFSLSRGAFVGSIFIAIMFIIIVFKHHKNKVFLAMKFSFFLLIISLFVFVFKDSLFLVINWIWNIGADDRGRIEVYEDAIKALVNHPLFGGTLASRIDNEGFIHHYHNTFLHTLACLGTFGFFALLFHLYQKFRLLLSNKTFYKTFALIAIISTHIHGLFDNTYFTTTYMVLIILWLAIIENDSPEAIINNDCNLSEIIV